MNDLLMYYTFRLSLANDLYIMVNIHFGSEKYLSRVSEYFHLVTNSFAKLRLAEFLMLIIQRVSQIWINEAQ